MELKDNKNEAPLAYYREIFASKNPEELAKRSGFPYDGEAFVFQFLGREIRVGWPGMEAVFADTGAEASAAVRILLGRAILEGVLSPSAGKFMAYREFPWGSVYNAQFTGRCIRRLAAAYGDRPKDFAAACEKLDGIKIPGGDISYELGFLPGLKLRLSLWEGDEEFPASAQILFSENFPAVFTAEDMAVAGDVLLNAMKGRW